MGGPRQRRAHVLASNEDGGPAIARRRRAQCAGARLGLYLAKPPSVPACVDCKRAGTAPVVGGCASRTDSPVKQHGSRLARDASFGAPSRPGALNSGARAGPFPFFPSLSKEAMERREAPPADRRRLANPNPGSAARHGRSPVTRGCRFRARWPNDVGPGASRRSNPVPLSGTAFCSSFECRDRRHTLKNKTGTHVNSYWIDVNPRA